MIKLSSSYIRYFVVGILLGALALGSFGLIQGTETEAPRELIPISKPECITRQNYEKPNIIYPNQRIICPQETEKIGNHFIHDKGLIQISPGFDETPNRPWPDSIQVLSTRPCPLDTTE